MRFELIILGSNAATPAHGRHMSSQCLKYNDDFFLIDCAEGTQFQIQKYKIKYQKINHIFVSHLHGDHIFGLPGFIMTMSMNQRREKLNLYGPSGLKKFLEFNFEISQGHLNFEIEYIETNPKISQRIFENDNLSVDTVPLKHRIPAHGFLFKEKPNIRKMKKEKITELGIPFKDILSIKMGNDWQDNQGNVFLNSELTFSPPNQKSYAYCSDTSYSEEIIDLVNGVDLLYHEATFLHEMHLKAESTGHSTALQAATIAKKAKVNKLLLGHFSSRYADPDCLLQEARVII